MNVQNTNLLIGEEDLKSLAQAASQAGPAEEAKPATKKRTRKVKPYEALKTVTEHAAAKKEAKKSGKTPAKKALAASKKGAKTRGKKAAVPAPKKSKPEPKPYGAKGDGVSTCKVCGKPLSRTESVQNGIGPECQRQMGRLPQGVTMEQHYEDLIVMEEPKGFIKLKEAIALAKKKGVSQYKFMIAIGGNRMLRPPLSPAFKTVLYKGGRWVSKASTSDKELKPLLK